MLSISGTDSLTTSLQVATLAIQFIPEGGARPPFRSSTQFQFVHVNNKTWDFVILADKVIHWSHPFYHNIGTYIEKLKLLRSLDVSPGVIVPYPLTRNKLRLFDFEILRSLPPLSYCLQSVSDPLISFHHHQLSLDHKFIHAELFFIDRLRDSSSPGRLEHDSLSQKSGNSDCIQSPS